MGRETWIIVYCVENVNAIAIALVSQCCRSSRWIKKNGGEQVRCRFIERRGYGGAGTESP